jgi:hypothetical protein
MIGFFWLLTELEIVMRDIGRSRRRKPRNITIPLDIVPQPEEAQHKDETQNGAPLSSVSVHAVSMIQYAIPGICLNPHGNFVIKPSKRELQVIYFRRW